LRLTPLSAATAAIFSPASSRKTIRSLNALEN
jgi:hypothetical protein